MNIINHSTARSAWVNSVTAVSSKAAVNTQGVQSGDTVTLSAQAQQLSRGETPAPQQLTTYEHLGQINRISPVQLNIPDKPSQEVDDKQVEYRGKPEINIDDFLGNAFQNILDSRMGIDKEKLKEIEAMMEEVAKDESLSPEQKEKRLEELQELYDDVIEQAVERQAQQEQNPDQKKR